MRKMLMRICLGVVVPGGPWALEVKTDTNDISTETTVGTASGTGKSPDRFDASISLSAEAFGAVRE